MDPIDPNEPLPTTPVGQGGTTHPPASAAPAAQPAGQGWGAPPPGWGGGGWGPPPPWMPPPAPPRRDRLALAVVAFIFGGIFLVFFGFLLLAYGAVRGESPRLGSGSRIGVIEVKGPIGTGGEGVDAERVL